MHWSLIVYCGVITFLTRFTMIFALKKDIFNDKTKKILSYVPAAITGYFSKHIIATIFAGLISYWFLIFFYF